MRSNVRRVDPGTAAGVLPRSLVAARLLLAACAGLWFTLSLFSATVAWPRLAGATPLAPVLVGLMVANGAVFTALARALRRPTRFGLAASTGWAALNFVLSFTDQVGALDLASAGLTLGTLVTLATAWRSV